MVIFSERLVSNTGQTFIYKGDISQIMLFMFGLDVHGKELMKRKNMTKVENFH